MRVRYVDHDFNNLKLRLKLFIPLLRFVFRPRRLFRATFFGPLFSVEYPHWELPFELPAGSPAYLCNFKGPASCGLDGHPFNYMYTWHLRKR